MLRVSGRRGGHHVGDTREAHPFQLLVWNLLDLGTVLQYWIPQVYVCHSIKDSSFDKMYKYGGELSKNFLYTNWEMNDRFDRI